jgi:hypothetical protein
MNQDETIVLLKLFNGIGIRKDELERNGDFRHEFSFN